jgi:hypothetical protein
MPLRKWPNPNNCVARHVLLLRIIAKRESRPAMDAADEGHITDSSHTSVEASGQRG